jgi:uronate dehydrogenase
MKVALSGAKGNVGAILRAQLLARGWALRSADLAALEPLTPGEEVCCGDLRDPAAVDALLHGVDVLIHMAGTSVEKPLDVIIENNLNALVQVYEGARRNGVRRVIFASSNHAIGMYRVDEPGRLPTDCAFRPDTFYGLSKMWGEGLARMYWDKHDVESVCIRIGSCEARPTQLRHLSTWLGHEDLVHLVERCVLAPEVGFSVIWGVSANSRSYWDNALAAQVGYRPTQNAEDFAHEVLSKVNPLDPIARQFQGGGFVTLDYGRGQRG